MNFKYCPNCGQKGTVKMETASKYVCANCQKIFYNNPSATVAVIFLKDNQALFAKRGLEPNKGKYDFPGGFVEFNEDVYDACVREIKEELGANISREDLKLLTVYTAEYLPGVSVTDMVFLANKLPDKLEAADDVAELEWKPLSFLASEQFVPHYFGLEKLLARHV